MLRGKTCFLAFVVTLLNSLLSGDGRIYAQSDIWVTAYYAGWMQGWHNTGVLPAEGIDYSAITHIIHFGLVPRSDGSINSDANSIVQANSSELLTRAHAGGKKVLICVGGWGTDVAFRGATSISNRSTFVSNLVNFMTSRGYDGIDVDWEVLEAADAPQFTLFIKELRSALDSLSARPLLTAAVVWQPGVFATLANEFDQINIMTYDLSGAWPGWVTWHNAPIYNGGFVFPSTGRPVVSADRMADNFIAAGVPPTKLGIGIDFYGYIWSGGSGTSTGGATQPRQTWSSPPQVQVNVPFYTIVRQFYQPEHYRWDHDPQASYLSIDQPGSSNDKFVSYDNEIACQRKVEYARTKGLGGVFIWELGGGYLPSEFPNRDRLLQTIKNTADSMFKVPTTPDPKSPVNNIVGLSIRPKTQWETSPYGSFYRVQVASDSTFLNVITDQNWIIRNDHILKNLSPNTLYYWRVNSSNPFSESEWSQPSKFTTTPDISLPPSWMYVQNTGHNGTFHIPASADPKINKKSLLNGDIVGVFFRIGFNFVCAGFSVWQEGTDMILHAWEDDAQTSAREGFIDGDSIHFRIWRRDTRHEYAAQATYASGAGTYTRNGSYVLRSLVGSSVDKQKIHLAKGWNMISSYIDPTEPAIDSVIGPIKANMVLLKNAAGHTLWPDSGIKTISSWNPLEGYQIYMRKEDSLTLQGDELVPDSIQIPLNEGWNIPSYLRSSSMRMDSALASLNNTVVLVKNIDGLVFWPELAMNTIGSMKPGLAYKIHVDRPVSLRYPPNTAISSSIEGGSESGPITVPSTIASSTISSQDPATGSNATLLVEVPYAEGGEQILVYTDDKSVVGRGTINRGKALIVLRGDNFLTSEVSEGAREGQSLIIEAQEKGRILEVHSLIDGLTNEALSPILAYKTDGAWIARMKAIPTEFILAQNYPNPFNSSTIIRYSVPFEAKVTVEIFDLLGQRISILVDEAQEAGTRTVTFADHNLASGVYFYRLVAEKVSIEPQPIFKARDRILSQIRKMILLR